jgi:hypothetical protein
MRGELFLHIESLIEQADVIRCVARLGHAILTSTLIAFAVIGSLNEHTPSAINGGRVSLCGKAGTFPGNSSFNSS